MSITKNLFEFSINFRDDQVFTNLSTIRTHFIYAIVNNFSLINQLVQSQPAEVKYPMNVGNFYNLFSISNVIKKFSEEDIYKIAATFRASLMNSTFSTYAGKVTDPVQCLMYFTKYFYIPVRLDYNTIPDNLKLEFLNTWLTTISLTICSKELVNKYSDIIMKTEVYLNCISQFLHPTKGLDVCSRARGRLTFQMIDKYLNCRQDDNAEQIFITVLNKIFIYSNKEIITKFCPNYNTVKTINKKYDRSWISFVDEDINFQINKLMSIGN